MSKNKDRNKERQKLFRKVRNISSWKRVVLYLLMIILFTISVAMLAVFVMEYIFESKFAEEYSKMEYIARLYELGKDDPKIMDFIEAGDKDFFVVDKENNILYQKGRNTSYGSGAYVAFSNGSEFYYVYPDSEDDTLIPNDRKGLDFNWKKLAYLYKSDSDIKIERDSDLEADPEDDLEWEAELASDLREDLNLEVKYNSSDEIKFPIWVSIELSEKGQRFIGKIYFSFSKRDTILAMELLISTLVIVGVIIIAMLVSIIRSVINYRRVSKLFYSDPVTKGHNWAWYLRNGDERIQNSWNKEDSFAVVNLVFRNYRNYCLCHSIEEGGKLLSNIDKMLNSQLQRYEICAHATMSNFALLLRYQDQELLKARLQDMIKLLQTMEEDHNFEFQLGVDFILPRQNENGKIVRRRNCSIEDIYNNACSARATLGDKEESGIRFFDNKLLEEQRWRDIVHESQSGALHNEEFVVYYQPKYDPNTKVLRGAEALIRWMSPKYGFVSPGRFIPIFEKNGFITQIDHYMISHVAADQRAWLDAGYQCVPVSVNVSRAHFVENDLAEQIRDLVDSKRCPRNLIEIELTESAFFDDKNAMIETIKRLKGYGFAVSMDDFGAGYSSLNSLKDMPLDVLKLDADFFRGEDAGVRGEIVVSEAIRLAKSLHMRTVAEGVEEKNQVDFLAAQGCDMIQGFYFAKPMPKEEYAKRMATYVFETDNVEVTTESEMVAETEVTTKSETTTETEVATDVEETVEPEITTEPEITETVEETMEETAEETGKEQ